MLPEVFTARLPVDNVKQIQNAVRKIMLYESLPENEPYLNNMLFAGEYLWNSDAGVPMYGDDLMEELKVKSEAHGIITTGVPNSYNFINFYEKNNTYNKTNFMSAISKGVHMINHLGHSINDMNMKIYIRDLPKITNVDKPFFGYSQGCYPGAFDNRSTNYTVSYDAIVEQFITSNALAFGFIGNTRYGWGDNNTTKGPSQMFHRQFINAVFGDKTTNIAKAHEDSKVKNIGIINETAIRWVMYEATYFGDALTELRVK